MIKLKNKIDWTTHDRYQIGDRVVFRKKKYICTANKYDDGKVPLELLPFDVLWECAKVLQFGAKKYGRQNWRKGMEWTRMLGASLRHTSLDLQGIDFDEESGLYHLAHSIISQMFALHYKLNKVGIDDRFKSVRPSTVTTNRPARSGAAKPRADAKANRALQRKRLELEGNLRILRAIRHRLGATLSSKQG